VFDTVHSAVPKVAGKVKLSKVIRFPVIDRAEEFRGAIKRSLRGDETVQVSIDLVEILYSAHRDLPPQ